MILPQVSPSAHCSSHENDLQEISVYYVSSDDWAVIKIVSKWLQSAAEGGCAALGEKARRLLRLITDQELTFKEHSDQLCGK